VAVHERLARTPLPRLKEVEREFFETFLGQKMSDEPVRVLEGLVITK